MMKKNKTVYALLLAGGSGERLWPLSRRNKPKQLLAFGEQQSLLEQTVDRICPLVDQEHRWIVTTEQQSAEIKKLVGDKVGLIATEPCSRNTGPAILLQSFAIHARDPQAMVVVMPSDHFIPDQQLFIEFVSHAINSALLHEKIVMLGIKPTYPATGYGYVEYQKQESFPCKVIRFCEKPSLPLAQQYMALDNVLWNIGIFCAPVSLLIQEFEQHAPELFNAVKAYFLGQAAYEQAPNIAIDYAIMEKSLQLLVVPANFVWCDVGNLKTFLSLKKQYKRNTIEVITIDAHDNLIDVEQKIVALIGVDNLCIVQSEGVLLIAQRDNTEKVKLVLETLKHNNSQEYL